ncbi:hypothetical protein D3C74_342010 [compost metagenome]
MFELLIQLFIGHFVQFSTCNGEIIRFGKADIHTDGLSRCFVISGDHDGANARFFGLFNRPVYRFTRWVNHRCQTNQCQIMLVINGDLVFVIKFFVRIGQYAEGTFGEGLIFLFKLCANLGCEGLNFTIDKHMATAAEQYIRSTFS